MHLLRCLGWWWQRRRWWRGWGRWRQGQAGQLDRLQGWRGRGLTLLRWGAATFLGTAGGPGPLLRAAGTPLAVGWCICGERDVGKVTVNPHCHLDFPFSLPTHPGPRAILSKPKANQASEENTGERVNIFKDHLVADASLSGDRVLEVPC